MTIDELYEAFDFVDDWEDRYSLIIDLGRKLPEFPETDKVDQNRVWGCTSRVWLINEALPTVPRTLRFVADSDALIVRGLIGILLMLYTDKSANDILNTDANAVFTRLGLEHHLSPNRRSGFFSMVEKIKVVAKQHAV